MSSGTFQVKEPELEMPAVDVGQLGSRVADSILRRTSNGNTLVQVVASTASEVNGDGALSSGLPGKVDRRASLSVQAGSRDVERVGAV